MRTVVKLSIVALSVPWPQAVAQDPLAQPLEVRGVRFVGNTAIDDAVLRNAIATSQSSGLRWLGLGEKRYLDQAEFRRDVLRVSAFYRQSGFIDAEVDTTVTRIGSYVWIDFAIDEGNPIVVTELTVEGLDGIDVPRNLRDRLPLRQDGPFDRLRLRASADTIRTVLADLGHPFAAVYTNFDEDRLQHHAQVHFVVDPEQRSRIGDITVIGARTIPEDAVRQRLLVQPGQPYSAREVYASQLDLYRSNLYNSVNVRLLDSVPPLDSLVSLQLRVSESRRHRIRLGAGYGTTDCFRTVGQWGINSFLGGARQLLLNARLSRLGVGGAAGLENKLICSALADDLPELQTLNYNLSASLTEPYFIWRRTRATLSVFGERQSEFQAYRRDAVGGDMAFTRHLGVQSAVTLSYALIRGRTFTDPAKQCAFLNLCAVEDTVFNVSRLTSRVALRYVLDQRNSILDPSLGSVLRADFAWAGKAIGSDSLSQFLNASVDFARYHRVARGHTFSWRVYLGAQTVPRITFAGGSGRVAPPEERFYAGGATTVRGYAQNGLGPVVHVLERVTLDTATGALDSIVRTSPVGGNGVLVMNAEYRFPLDRPGGRLSGALFVDVGQVFESGDDMFALAKMRITPGAGLRIVSPLGPVRLDVAYNPHGPTRGRLFRQVGSLLEQVSLPGDGLYEPPGGGLFSRLRLHFSIGQAF